MHLSRDGNGTLWSKKWWPFLPKRSALPRIFQTQKIPDIFHGAAIQIVWPDMDVKELGVSFTNASQDGMLAGYQYGLEKGRKFCLNAL